jgi:hypothetical protein
MPRATSKQVKRPSHSKTDVNSPGSGHPPAPSTALMKRPLSPASVEKAQKAFGNFSLSKFANKSLPTNHVGEAKDPSAVHAVQRTVISQQIATLRDSDVPSAGMTIALPAETMKTLLPTYDEETGTVQLDDLLSVMTRRMGGTEFFYKGNPTLNRLALQSKVDQIVQSVKGEAKK